VDKAVKPGDLAAGGATVSVADDVAILGGDRDLTVKVVLSSARRVRMEPTENIVGDLFALPWNQDLVCPFSGGTGRSPLTEYSLPKLSDVQ
jgi:hypothetical protein